MVIFYECLTLENISLPNSITSIGENAFGKCDDLMNFDLPSNLTTLEAGNFL